MDGGDNAQALPEDGVSYRGPFVRRLVHAERLYHTMPAFQSRDFRLFWVGQLVSLIGTWVQSVAQQWLVLQLTHSAFALGLVTTIQFTPVLALSLVGGAVADRVSKRDLLLVTQVISACLAVGLGVLVQTGAVRYWEVLLSALILGTVNSFYTPARQAFVPELVEKDALLNAVALNSTIFNGARVVGPALGGVLIATVGLSLNFYINAASYLAVIIGLLIIARRPPRARDKQDRIWRNVADGLQYVRAAPVIYTILALIGVTSLFALNFTTLMPLFARYVLHVGSDGFGFLMASMGIGSLTGAILLAFINRRDLSRRLIFAGVITFSTIEILFGFSRVFWLSLALLVLIGFFSTLFTTTANTRILSLTPSHLQGRVMSVYSLLFLGVTPFGSFVSGLIAQRYGAPIALILGAAITLVFTLVILIAHPERRAAAAREPGT